MCLRLLAYNMGLITIKSKREIGLMRQAGRAAAAARDAAAEAVTPGVTTAEIDMAVRMALKEYGAAPSFLGYNGFPAAACISGRVNAAPSDRSRCRRNSNRPNGGAS